MHMSTPVDVSTNDLNTRIFGARYTPDDLRNVVIMLKRIQIEIRDGLKSNPYTHNKEKVGNPLEHAERRLAELFEIDPHQPHDLYWGTAATFVGIPLPCVPGLAQSRAEELGAQSLRNIVEQALYFNTNIVRPACKQLDEAYRGYLMFATRNAIRNLHVAQRVAMESNAEEPCQQPNY